MAAQAVSRQQGGRAMSRVLAMLALLATLPAFAATDTHREWRFNVALDGRAVGTHVYEVDAGDGGRSVRSTARFDVKVLLFDAYTYAHEAREQWQGDCLKSLSSRTDDNGKQLSVEATGSGNRMVVTSGATHVEISGCVMSFAYWNPAILTQKKLLNAQTGEYDDVRIEPLGEETIAVRGVPVQARRYALHAPEFRIDVWYAADGNWVQLESLTKGGRMLHYSLQ
ncbi:MAG: DUF6134 family protein [Casimicrobiaceae bacterium]